MTQSSLPLDTDYCRSCYAQLADGACPLGHDCTPEPMHAAGPWIPVKPPRPLPERAVLVRRGLGDIFIWKPGERWHPDFTHWAEIRPPEGITEKL